MADEPKGCGGQRNFKVYIAGFRKICPHSWDSFPPHPPIYSVWPRIGREGPSVDECNVRSHVNGT